MCSDSDGCFAFFPISFRFLFVFIHSVCLESKQMVELNSSIVANAFSLWQTGNNKWLLLEKMCEQTKRFK